MEAGHDPVINHRPDGRWEINCPRCLMLRASGVDVPIGIGIAIRSWEAAVLVWENHVRQVESPGQPGYGVVTSLRPS